jgi:hypothetical protein
LKRHPDIIHDAMQTPAVRENIHTCRQGSQAACAENLTRIGVKSRTGITCLNIYCDLIPQRFAMTINYLWQFASTPSLTGEGVMEEKRRSAAFLKTSIES